MLTEQVVITVVNALKDQSLSPFLYQENIIRILNRKSDVEVIAEILLKNYEPFRNIGTGIKIRSKWCDTYNHNGELPAEKTRLTEKRLAIALFNEKQFCFGNIFDYEVPLKANEDDVFGKIDLVALHEEKENKSIKLIELKIKSSETLLRAVVEIYTYCKLIAQFREIFLADYHKKITESVNNAPSLENLQKDFHFQPVILSDNNSMSGEMMRDIGKYPSLRKLILEINKEFKNELNEFEFYGYNYNANNEPFIFKDNIPLLKDSLKITKHNI